MSISDDCASSIRTRAGMLKTLTGDTVAESQAIATSLRRRIDATQLAVAEARCRYERLRSEAMRSIELARQGLERHSRIVIAGLPATTASLIGELNVGQAEASRRH